VPVEARIEREARPVLSKGCLLRFIVDKEADAAASSAITATPPLSSRPPAAALPVPLRRIAARRSISSRYLERVEKRAC